MEAIDSQSKKKTTLNTKPLKSQQETTLLVFPRSHSNSRLIKKRNVWIAMITSVLKESDIKNNLSANRMCIVGLSLLQKRKDICLTSFVGNLTLYLHMCVPQAKRTLLNMIYFWMSKNNVTQSLRIEEREIWTTLSCHLTSLTLESLSNRRNITNL